MLRRTRSPTCPILYGLHPVVQLQQALKQQKAIGLDWTGENFFGGHKRREDSFRAESSTMLRSAPIYGGIPSIAAAGAVDRTARAVPRGRHAICQAGKAGKVNALPKLDESYETLTTFSDYANWLIPGSLMVGRYPHIEPARCKERKVGEAQLERLISNGIRTFYCLQGELPPQSEMPIKGVNGFEPYKAPATLIAASLSDPMTSEEMNGLRTPYLDKYLPPKRKAYQAPRRIIDLDFLHSPIKDLSVPQWDQLERLVDEISGRLEDGDCIYVHCWGGRGRAGTVGACVLGRMYGLEGEEALERVQRAYATRDERWEEGELAGQIRPSPEKEEQKQLVRDFLRG
jgi:hypothetical protein